MTAEELVQARAWAETAEPYPVKAGFLALLDEIDRLHNEDLRGAARTLIDHSRDRLVTDGGGPAPLVLVERAHLAALGKLIGEETP